MDNTQGESYWNMKRSPGVSFHQTWTALSYTFSVCIAMFLTFLLAGLLLLRGPSGGMAGDRFANLLQWRRLLFVTRFLVFRVRLKTIFKQQLVKMITLKGKYRSTDNTKHRRKRTLLLRNEEISRQKSHTNIWKLNWDILMIRDLFLNQKSINVREHTVKMAPRESFWKGHQGACETGRDGGRIIWGIPGLCLEDRTNW